LRAGVESEDAPVRGQETSPPDFPPSRNGGPSQKPSVREPRGLFTLSPNAKFIAGSTYASLAWPCAGLAHVKGAVMKNMHFAMLAAALAVSGCATNQKVATAQLGDERLSCEQIRSEDSKMNDILERAQHNKGVSGANVAAVLLFWPAAIGNYMDADKAEGLVTKRKDNLAAMYREKRCGQPEGAPVVAYVAPTPYAPPTPVGMAPVAVAASVPAPALTRPAPAPAAIPPSQTTPARCGLVDTGDGVTTRYVPCRRR
jgi:hypothetical protein